MMESRRQQRLARQQESAEFFEDMQRRLALIDLQTSGSSQPQPQTKNGSKTMKDQTSSANDTATYQRNLRDPPLQAQESYNRPMPSTSTYTRHPKEHDNSDRTNQPRQKALHPNKNAQPVCDFSINENKHLQTIKSHPNNDAMHKQTKNNQKTEAVAVVLCVQCDKKITGGVRNKSSSSDDVGFTCSKCNDSAVYCYECTLYWGSFCAGQMCKKFYCDACRPEYIGEEGGDQYCGRTCMGRYHPDFEKYSRHRVPFSEEEQEEDKIASIFGYRQCKGITKQGFRCRIKSEHDGLWSASSLKSGDDFCMHHGGRVKEFEEEAWDCYSLDEGWDCT